MMRTLCPPLFCVADDITGAAEIAGVALSQGLRVSLLMYSGQSAEGLPECDVCVVATDSRSMTPHEAASCVADVCRLIIRLTGGRTGICVFKKTDSVLRGNILHELTAMAGTLNKRRVMLLAQNPSKGRIVKDGEYLVSGVPLHETDFSSDPEFPAVTSDATAILRHNAHDAEGSSPQLLPAVNLALDRSPMPEDAISVADAASQAEIMRQLHKTSAGTLLAGGADFFAAVARKAFEKASTEKASTEKATTANADTATAATAPDGSILGRILRSGGKVMAVCGSTQSESLISQPLLQHTESREEPMPDNVFEGHPADAWHSRLMMSWKRSRFLAVCIGKHPRRGAEYARRLRREMALAVGLLCSEQQPEALVIEGGATAFSLLSLMGWQMFQVESQLSPGVVALRLKRDNGSPRSPIVILKPGSYPWGGIFG